jgi:hypothetical protein
VLNARSPIEVLDSHLPDVMQAVRTGRFIAGDASG